ncbi:MATE family efflux transporter [Litorilinea aerophila]|uniref:MATE family efflux transporter n=1 Tax=Litorilinea aerophila TaxID=1204385 RepID=A0A540VKI6_9CHLR|nr:MATE family efflux transporter [Litorilinea aerophila]MCC9075342.1 MATE family efflux transporter [Litorilinea aerophila]GIV79271.1 MAG: MATE family efflux transporter [Litorilinea sp.]
MKGGRQAALVHGPVGKTLIDLTIPMIFGIVGMVAFNLVDTFFVGQLGTRELAAMSFTFPVVMVISSVAFGIGIGGSAVISRAIGEGNQDRVRRLTTDLLALALTVVILFVLLGLLTIEPVFRLLGATPDLIPLIREYMTIWYLAMVFLVVPMVGNNAIRATGDTRTPSFVMLVAVLVNVVLDPLLIFGIGPFPRLELAGAALATVISRAVTFAVAVWVLYFRDRMVTFVWPGVRPILASWRRILYIGLPAAATNMIVPVSVGVVTRLIATYGAPAVAAFGVASRIDMFALTVLMALSTVLGPFIGQNWGAGRHDRVQAAIRYSEQFSLAWGLLMFLLLGILARPLAELFNRDPAVVETVVLYLRVLPISYGFQGILRMCNFSLNVLEKPLYATALTVLQMFVLYVPLAYLGSALWGLIGIFAAAVAAHVIAGGAAHFVLRQVLAAGARARLAQAKAGVA